MADNQPALVFRVAATIEELKKNLAEGKNQIEVTQQALVKMAASYDGSRLIQQAGATAAAIQQIGGVTNLTAAEQAKANTILEAAIEKYRLLGKEAPPGMQALADATKKIEPPTSAATQAFGGLASQIQANIVGFVSAQAIIGGFTSAVHALTGFVAESVGAYAESEGAQIRLTSALRQHALATPEVIDQYNALATTFQRTTIYADEQINAMEGLLTQVGGVMPSKMREALKASTDLAAGLGIDLQSATMLVAKAAAGHTETLGRYGITVSQAEVATRGFDAVLEAVNRQFGGQAQAAIETYTGKVKQIENSWNNVQEALGKIILTNPLVVAALSRITEAAAGADKASSETNHSFSDLLAKLGFIDPVTHAAASALEDYVDGLNTVEESQKRLGAMPSPFAKWASDNSLPAITSGMKIAAEQWREHEKDAKAATEAYDKFRDSLVDLAAVGEGWRGTLDTIDGSVVEAIRYYLEAGVAQDKLASAYYLTAAQVKAVASQLKDEQDAWKIESKSIEETTKLWDEYFALRVQHGGTAADAQIAQIHKWADDLAASMQKAGADTTAFYNALTAVTAEKLNGVRVDWGALASASKEALQETFEKAQATYEAALTSSLHFSSAAMQHFRDLRDAARDAFYGIDASANTTQAKLEAVNAAVMGLTSTFHGWNDQVMNSGSMAFAALEGDLNSTAKSIHTLGDEWITAADAKKRFDMGNTLDLAHAARDPEIMDLLKAGWSLENAESIKLARQWGYTPKLYDDKGNPETQPSKGERVPGYEKGVINAPGGWAMVGEKGPERMYVPPGANIYPTGSAAGAGSITIHVNVSGVWDSRSKVELTDVVSAGLLKKLVALGYRPPSGA